MLFPYKYVSHDIEKAQGYLDFIFFEVWVNAINYDEFEITLFDNNQELRNIIMDFVNAKDVKDKKNWRAYFIEKTRNIFYIFKTLNKSEIQKLKYWYAANNNISKVCAKKLTPIKYKELAKIHPILSKELNDFYMMLYDYILNKSAIVLNTKTIKDHNTEFVKINNKEICPFCAISPMKGENSSKREAYDHYLPKALYPFNSLNFKNLAPMCNECNSTNKGSQDPIFHEDIRRKAFYPYQQIDTDITISLTITATRKDNITANSINLDIYSIKYDEEVATWKSIFGIDERYKRICSSKSEGLEWIVELTDDLDNYNTSIKNLFSKNFLRYLNGKVTKKVYITILDYSYKRNPYARKRFLQVLHFRQARYIFGIQ